MTVFNNFIFDNGASNVAVTSYTSGGTEIPSGDAWTAVFGYGTTVPWITSSGDNMYAPSGSCCAAYVSGSPATADYDVEADITLSGGNRLGVLGRCSTTAETFYMARMNTTVVELYEALSGSFSLIGSSSKAFSGTLKIKLEMRGDQISVYVDDVLEISPVTNSSITAKGFAGVRINSSSLSARIDNFTSTDAESGGSTISPIKVNAGLVNSSLTVPRLIA